MPSFLILKSVSSIWHNFILHAGNPRLLWALMHRSSATLTLPFSLPADHDLTVFNVLLQSAVNHNQSRFMQQCVKYSSNPSENTWAQSQLAKRILLFACFRFDYWCLGYCNETCNAISFSNLTEDKKSFFSCNPEETNHLKSGAAEQCFSETCWTKYCPAQE